MSDRVQKQRKSSTERKNALLRILLESQTVEMPSCSSCESLGAASCEASPQNPNRCIPCVRNGRSRCDIQGISVVDLEHVGAQYQKMELEMAKAEEERRAMDAKIERLRKQKKMWFEKMMRAVRRGLSSVEELEKVEKVEADREAARVAENRPPSATSVSLGADFTATWDAVYSDVELTPEMMATWVPLISDTPQAAPGSSQGELLVPMCFPSHRILSI